ncbi:MAG: M28 family peptidase [Planctomycetota bacterium]
MIRMPGKSYNGPLTPPSSDELVISDQLRQDVKELAGRIGERNVYQYSGFVASVEFLKESLSKQGYKVQIQDFTAERETCSNISVEVTGGKLKDEIVVVGAHYDSVFGTTGANDNASGVAATLALARLFADSKPQRTLRFVFFANEEPPFFQTEQMGSLVYAKSCRQKEEKIVAMLSLETIGYYSDQKNSQKYPFPFSLFYPSTGNFIGFVSDLSSRKLLHKSIASFRKNCKFPSQGGAIPRSVPGSGWSDHWAFWQHGYPAIMVTDTAPFRYPYYHTAEDTPERIDYDRMARVLTGLVAVVTELTDSQTK